MNPKLRYMFPLGSQDFFKANGLSPNEPTLAAAAYEHKKLGEIIKITFKGNPVSKQRPRVVVGHAFTPKETKTAEKAIGLFLLLSYPGIEPDGEHCFEVTIRFFCAARQRKDLDNMTKLVLDACNGVVWEDDSQVTSLSVSVKRASDFPRTELSITAIESDIPYIICAGCGKKVRTYQSTEKTRRFCSRACSAKSQESPRIPCLICGELFRPGHLSGRRNQKFCSRTCSGKAHKGVPKNKRVGLHILPK